jgi:hypothetical protein
VPNGKMNANTQNALQQFISAKNLNTQSLDQNVYLALYENVPIDAAARQRRISIDGGVADLGLATQAYSRLKVAASGRKAKIYETATRTAKTTADIGQLRLSTSKSEYRVGEKLKVNFSVDKPMYVGIALINSQGKMDIVYPNPYQRNNYCLPGKKYSIPAAGADFSLDISGPAGTDKLRAVASAKPIVAESLAFTKEGQFDELHMGHYKVRAAADYIIH